MYLELKKNNYLHIISFLASCLIHSLIFVCFLFFSHFLLPNVDKKNQKIVYMQILSSSKTDLSNVPLSKEKIIKKNEIKENKPVSSKPSSKIQDRKLQLTPDKPISSHKQLTLSNVQEANSSIHAPVVEALVDKVARCQTPEIPITPDAANAGITSGKIILEVQISEEGNVTEAKILKGTGFQIDDEVINLAKKMKCIPAEKDGKKVRVIKRLQWIIQR